jgi:F1F0 ATPase subunit 2
MTMREPLMLGLAGGVGLLLGAVFFGGLWWTVRTVVSSGRPPAWLAGSLVLRTGIVLVGFYVLGRGDWGRLVACLAGFIVARLLVTGVIGLTPQVSRAP